METYFRVSVHAARSGIAAAVVLGVGRAIGEAMAIIMVAGNVANMPGLFTPVRFLTTGIISGMAYASVGSLYQQALLFHRPGAVPLYHAHQCVSERAASRTGRRADMNGQTLIPSPPGLQPGDACAGVAVRRTDLRAAGVFDRLYFLPGDARARPGSCCPARPAILRIPIGILPNILNTLYIILVAMVIVLPLGVGAAIYLTEYAENRRLVSLIEFAAETLTGIPSIIFGLVGMLFFVQKMNLQAGVLAGGLTLVVMILPTILRTTQESLKTVPQSYREGALGLGAGKWRMIRTVVLPNAIDGIVTGCILAVGRIVGESAALLYTAGFGLVLNDFFTALAHLLRHADGGSVCLRQRAGRDGGGLLHCHHSDAADPAHQPLRRVCWGGS